MKFWSYLKDRGVSMGLQLLACLLVLLFMYAFAVPMSLVAVSVGIIFSFTLLSWILDYLKRRTFYRELTGVMEQLGEKYLVSEMVEKPDFYEGEMLWDVLYTTNKSMLENITEREMKTREFTDYVEAWIHEVKIPLASLNLMCRDLDRKYIRQLDRIDRQLDQILYYIRSGNAEKDYLIRRVSLAETVKNVALKNKDDLLERGIALEVNLECDTVMTDGKWLEFMLNQIINNSVKYMKREIDGKSGEMMENESGKLPVEPGKTPGEEPRIRVTSGRAENGVFLRVWDNGIGIPAEDLPMVCRKTFTGQNGRRGAKSTGMGLYIVKSLCNKLGHRLDISSRQGEFTSVTIIFGENDFYFGGMHSDGNISGNLSEM
ncbi:MAG: sensor histidine kinase [Oscillospiraceae bacterium]